MINNAYSVPHINTELRDCIAFTEIYKQLLIFSPKVKDTNIIYIFVSVWHKFIAAIISIDIYNNWVQMCTMCTDFESNQTGNDPCPFHLKLLLRWILKSDLFCKINYKKWKWNRTGLNYPCGLLFYWDTPQIPCICIWCFILLVVDCLLKLELLF